MADAIPLGAIDAVCKSIHRQKVESRIDANYAAYKALADLRAAGWGLIRLEPVQENRVRLPEVDSL